MIRRRQKTTKTQKRLTNQSSHSLEAVGAGELTFLEHLYELRKRLFWITATLIVASAVGFQYKDYLVSFIIAPLHGEKLVYLTPGGGFSFIFTVCLYFGALLTIPVVMYHIYRFLQPVLGKTSRRFVALIIMLSTSLAAGGAIFGYVVAIPAAIQFLSTFAGDAVMPNLTAESYLGFIVAYMLGLAALFQLPLLLYIFDHVRPFPPGALLSSQRFVIAGAVIAAAIITPTPDIVNQLIVAGPIILIYQFGAAAVYLRHKVLKRRHQKHEAHSVEVAQPRPQKSAGAVSSHDDGEGSIQKPVQVTAHTPTDSASKPKKSLDGVTRVTSRSELAVPTRRRRDQQPYVQPVKRIDGISGPARRSGTLDGAPVQ